MTVHPELNTIDDDLQHLLRSDHARLETLFEQLVAAFAADARTDLSPLWATFEAGLQAHLALEERYILPEFEPTLPAEVAALASDHREIRRLLAQLGVGLDLHLVRAEAGIEFIEMLRRHAKREDALMYRWAQSHVAVPDRTTLRAELLDSVRRLVGKAVRP
jgi:hemerythrin-like domain-containing protein